MPSTTLRSWYAMGRWVFFARLASVGAVAGFATWALVFAGSLVWDIDPPSVATLVWAMLRGAVFALILGFILIVFWRRRRAEPESPP